MLQCHRKVWQCGHERDTHGPTAEWQQQFVLSMDMVTEGTAELRGIMEAAPGASTSVNTSSVLMTPWNAMLQAPCLHPPAASRAGSRLDTAKLRALADDEVAASCSRQTHSGRRSRITLKLMLSACAETWNAPSLQ